MAKKTGRHDPETWIASDAFLLREFYIDEEDVQDGEVPTLISSFFILDILNIDVPPKKEFYIDEEDIQDGEVPTLASSFFILDILNIDVSPQKIILHR